VSLTGFDSINLKLSFTVTEGITKGTIYRFRYRVKNAVGWSDFSDTAFILAANAPAKPPAPVYLSSTSTGVTLQFSQTLDDGGSAVTAYKLYRDDGDDFTSSHTLLGNYDGSSLTYSATVGSDGLVSGRVYRFTYVATNAIGDSLPSNELIAGVGATPPAPSAPVKNAVLSNSTSMFISWGEVTTADLPILGYVLWIDDGLGGDYSILYDGSLNPQKLNYQVFDLAPGFTYNFKVQAVDINGDGTLSSVSALISCVAPSGMALPTVEAVDETTVTLGWCLPADDGGCPITGYALFRDDGAGGTISNAVDAGTVANKPYLFSHTATLGAGFTGKTVRVKVEALNSIGSTLSPALSFVLADVPGKPTPAPSVDPTNTTTSQIKVVFQNANTDVGGSPVIGLELQMDDGEQGEFVTILNSTQKTSLVVTEDIQRGNIYRFRYRVQNVNGWSPYSDISYIKPRSIPTAPPAP